MPVMVALGSRAQKANFGFGGESHRYQAGTHFPNNTFKKLKGLNVRERI